MCPIARAEFLMMQDMTTHDAPKGDETTAIMCLNPATVKRINKTVGPSCMAWTGKSAFHAGFCRPLLAKNFRVLAADLPAPWRVFCCASCICRKPLMPLSELHHRQDPWHGNAFSHSICSGPWPAS